MKLKKILALALSLAMVLSIVPAFGIVAGAATETVLFDASTLDRTSSTGDIALSEGNWTGEDGVLFSNNWGAGTGTWGSNGTTALMFFRTGERGNGSTETKTATYGGASESAGANKITITFTYGIQNASNCYQTWYFRDVDGNRFARFYGDKNTSTGTASVGLNTQTNFISSGGTLGIRGQEFSIVATKNTSDWTVEYYKGTELLVTDSVSSINGFGSIQSEIPQWNDQYAAAAMQGLKITYELPETSVTVTATYTYNSKEITSVTKTYDSATETGATFPAIALYGPDGGNALYNAPETTLSASGTIEMTAEPNPGYNAGDKIVADNKVYTTLSGNLIPNGDFSYGLAGWYNGAGTAATFTNNNDGTITLGGGGHTGTGSLYRSWSIEPEATYIFTWTDTGSGSYHKASLATILNDGTADGTGPTYAPTASGTNKWVFTNTDYPYIRIRIRWSTDKVGNFGLYKVDPNYSEAMEIAVNFKNEAGDLISSYKDSVNIGESVTVPAQEVFVLDADYNGTIYEIKGGTFAASEDVTVYPSTTKFPAIEDALITGGNEIWGVKGTNNNSVFVSSNDSADRAPLYDANGDAVTDGVHTPSTLGTARVGMVEFPVVDIAAGQKAYAKFYVRTWHANTFSNSNTSIRLAAYAVTDNSWTTLPDGDKSYTSATATLLETYPNAIFSEAHDNSLGYITFDVTDAMKAAKAANLDVITLRLNAAWGAAYIAEREACVPGGAYEGKVSYIEVVDAGAFEVTAANGSATLTKNGSAMSGTATVAAGDDVRLVSEGAIVVKTNEGNYRPNTNLNLTAATNLGEINGYAFGINMKVGAAVRLGEGVTDQNKIAGNSGIRFIATIDSTSNITSAADQVGIVITAEGNTQEVEIPAVNYQDATTFTAALTNLNQSNYIREFTATPYAKVTFADGTSVTFKGNELNPENKSTRSIYEVSALGLTETPVDEIGKTVKDVMNAYVNSVGIRLTRTGDGMFARDAKLGDTALFTVEQSGTTVTIKPVNANVDLKAAEAWWIDYVRINNNNKTARNYISNPQFDETTGALTFTFEEPAAEQTTEPTTEQTTEPTTEPAA